MATTDIIRELRSLTGAGVMDCKKALEDAKGDINKAMELLKQTGLSKVQKKSSRTANEGIIETYVHSGGRIGVMLSLVVGNL